MRLEANKYLYDIQQASGRVAEFTAGKQFQDYQGNAMLRAAVERQFEIIGEALAQLLKLDEKLAARLSEHRRIIAFRNILIHGYADVDDRLVWDVATTKLSVLRREVDALLSEE
ncbi:MAG TPA: HepT-like ribonuclease domain-containing protein [Pyrinomonadaceae bacterium]|nr:HepT-like ribonuclease domain-containing protein [Pyrinomonadaceae bacterium]